MKVLFPLLLLLAAGPPEVRGQPIPVGDLRGELFRLHQLLSDSALTTSHTNRPLWRHSWLELLEREGYEGGSWWNDAMETPTHTIRSGVLGEVTLGVYEPVLTNTYNTHLPHGENNGAAWYGVGHNTEVRGGVWLTSDWFTLTFRPHYAYQQNRDFPPPRFIPEYPDGRIRYVAEGFLQEDTLAERIDRPFRFGPDPFSTWDLGETSLRVHYRQLELGVSNEPLWWGPAVNYPLVMSNNAPGLRHAFLGTREPLPLPWNAGSLDFRWILARPQDSDYFDLNLEGAPNELNRYEREGLLLAGRFMNGLNVAWTPSFVPNLTLGLSRVIHQYRPSERLGIAGDGPLGWSDYTAIFKRFPRPRLEAYEGSRDESYHQHVNGLASVWFRWVFPESNAEVYGEFYKEDHNWNLRDLITQPQHARAWTVGVQKLFEPSWADFVRVHAEFNSLLPGNIDEVRPQSYAYTHKKVKQGHTNRGQVLGAAIGPGSTSQYVGVEAWFERGKAGFFLQRVVENDQFHYEFYQRNFPEGGFKDQFHHQVKFNIGLNGTYRYGPLLLEGEMKWNYQLNYGRYDYGTWVGGYLNRSYEDDFLNVHYRLRLRYLF
ncbi:MAG: capsule assembly Wzi family protein [Balneolaceae bacterium]|nr:capsule assembly Wzi family protein [Balneolaceae bacterium]